MSDRGNETAKGWAVGSKRGHVLMGRKWLTSKGTGMRGEYVAIYTDTNEESDQKLVCFMGDVDEICESIDTQYEVAKHICELHNTCLEERCVSCGEGSLYKDGEFVRCTDCRFESKLWWKPEVKQTVCEQVEEVDDVKCLHCKTVYSIEGETPLRCPDCGCNEVMGVREIPSREATGVRTGTYSSVDPVEQSKRILKNVLDVQFGWVRIAGKSRGKIKEVTCLWHRCPRCDEDNIRRVYDYCPDCGVSIKWGVE